MNVLRNIFVFMELFYGFHLSAYVVDEDSFTLLELLRDQHILQDDILYAKRSLLTNLSARVLVLEEKAGTVTDEHDRHKCECKNRPIAGDQYQHLLEAFKDEKQECGLIANELETHKLDKVITDLSLRQHADAIQNIEKISDKLENDIKKANNVLEKLEKDSNDEKKQERDENQKLKMYGSPSFISDWVLMRSQDASLSERTVHHGLGSLPYKVEVQIRPVAGPNAGWTFRGDSVYQSDDDTGHRYGGIVYLYDNETVFLTAPIKANNKASGTVINTGEDLQFRLGSSHQVSSEAYVRVKVWGQDKWPTPDFESEWIPLDIYNETRAFHEIPHGLGDYPGFVNVQIRCFSETKFHVSEGVGASVKSSGYWHNTGGTVWAFNNQNTRVWTGYVQSKENVKYAYKLIGTRDGWPTSGYYPNSKGEVRVTAWKSKSFLPEKNFHVRHNKDTVFPEWVAPLPEYLDMEKDLASLYVQAEDGPNVGYRFPAYGNSQTTSPSYGGVVYAFHPTGAVRLWRPNPDKKGFLVHIQHPYGNGINVQKSNNASYILSVIKGAG